MRVVFFNGPPGCGKDTAVKAVMQQVPNCYSQKFAKPLEEGIRAFFGLGMLEYHELRERSKNMPTDVLLGRSMREVMISLSEVWAKQVFGPAVFGTLAVSRLPMRERPHTVLFSDCGFQAEVDVVVQHAGVENCLLVRLYREGCTYEGDSRSYIKPGAMHMIEVHNKGEIGVFQSRIVQTLKGWLL